MKPDLRSPRDLGEILGYSWRIYRSAFVTLFGIACIVAPLGMLLAVILRGVESENGQLGILAAFLIPSTIVTAIARGALIVAIHDFTGNTAPDAGRSVDLVFERIVAVVGAVLMYMFLLIAALLLSFPTVAIWWLINRKATIDGQREWWLVLIPLLLPIYLFVRWNFWIQAVMIKDLRWWRALDDSADSVRGAWWRTFIATLCISLVTLAPTLLASLSAYGPAYGEAIFRGATAALVLPYAVAAQTLLLYSLISRKAVADVSPA